MELLNSNKVPSSFVFNDQYQPQEKSTFSRKIFQKQEKISKKSIHDEENFGTKVFFSKYGDDSKTNNQRGQQLTKLQSLQEAKKNTIDSLNIKILSMVTKLSSSEFTSYSQQRERFDKQRLKTEYTISNYSRNEYEINSKHGDSLRKEKINSPLILSDSKIEGSGLSRSKYKEKSAKKYQLLRIKEKYKENTKKNIKTSFNHDYSEKFDKIQKNLPSKMQSTSTQQFYRNEKGEKKSIEMSIKEKYNKQNKRKDRLITEYQRKPLQDSTNLIEKYDQRQKLEKNQEQYDLLFKKKAKEDKEENESQPPTADFRMNQQLSQLQHFLKNIIHQIQVDSEFRKAKKWFTLLSSSSKWHQLTNCLLKVGVNFDRQSIEQIFTLNQEQEDPFYTFRDSDYHISNLAELFIICEENWFENIVKKYNRWELERSGFQENRIDFAKKGHIEIEDLIRFLNIQMNVQYRNRDVFLIYLRLKSQEKMQFQDIIELICH